jgi:hypothetical protein
VSAAGEVQERLVPRGAHIVTDAYPVRETLPAVFTRRAQNRGFESLSVSGDQRAIFTIIQSPLANPLPETAKNSRIGRLLKVDAASGAPVGEYALVLEAAATFGASSQGDIKISGAVWVAPDRLLIDQRTDETAKVFELQLDGATNILGTSWDDLAGPPLEALAPDALRSQGVVPVRSTLLADLGVIAPGLPGKIEGLALADDRTIVVGNDNEFAFEGCDNAQNVVQVSRPSELLFIRFGRPLR